MIKYVTSLDDLNFEIRAARKKIVIIDFFADWCGPCKIISPKLEELTNTLTNIVLVKVDVDEAEEVAEKYDVSVMPTFVVLKNGSVTDTFIGADTEKIEKMFIKYNEEVKRRHSRKSLKSRSTRRI